MFFIMLVPMGKPRNILETRQELATRMEGILCDVLAPPGQYIIILYSISYHNILVLV
jgi:hypothetical protein